MSLSSNPWLNSALRDITLGLQQENPMTGQTMGCCAEGHHQSLPPSVETSVCSVVKVVPSVVVGRFCIVQLENGIDGSLYDVVCSVALLMDDDVMLQKNASRCLRVECTHVRKITLFCRKYFTPLLICLVFLLFSGTTKVFCVSCVRRLLFRYVWRSSFWPDIKEVEGVRQQEEQEDKRDEETGDEVNGEVEEVRRDAQHTHET